MSYAQENDSQSPKLWRSTFGVGGGVQRSVMSAGFKYLPGYPGCNPNPYENGTGTAKGLQAFWRYAMTDRWSLGAGIGYMLDDGTLAVNEATSINVDGVATPATIEHSIDASLKCFTLSPGVAYNITDRFGATFAAELGYLTSPSFASKEQLTEPSDRGVFEENGARIRNEQSGALPNATKLQSALNVGVRYMLPLNKLGSIALVPSAEYRIGITNLVSGLNWRENGLGGGLAIEYTPVDYPESPQTLPEPKHDTIPVAPKPPALLAGIRAAGVDSSGIEAQGLVQLRIEEMYEVSKVPLIPYIFFGNRSDTLDGRYMSVSEHESAQLENKPGTDRLRLYTDILNLIGERMQQHPLATLTLTGCTDPSERPHAVNLATSRAGSVREYLISAWNVDPKRIAVKSRELPDHASPVQDTDGQAENRRVEIASSDPAVLGPVSVGDTIRSATPPTVRFHPSVTSEARIDNWTIEAEQQGKLLARFNGHGAPPANIDWVVANDQSTVPRAPGVLDYRLRVRDTKNQLREAKGTMNVEQYTLRTKKKLYADDGKAEIENYSLVLFDFNSSELTKDNLAVLSEIKSTLKPSSVITITGYTDRIGDSSSNQQLALDRAKNVAAALGLPESVCRGASNSYPYPNTEPEGRFYSRTVQISVRNPVAQGE
jgi:outer membrane protein OmpA-like peptidoglycan-associated protein